MTLAVPRTKFILPISEDEFLRQGKVTEAPETLIAIWQVHGAFDAGPLDMHRAGVGEAYSLLDPYTCGRMLDPHSPLFLLERTGYPFVRYGRFTTFCLGDDSEIRFSYDDHVIANDVAGFLSSLSDDPYFVEKLTDDGRARDDPDAVSTPTLRQQARTMIDRLDLNDRAAIGSMMKHLTSLAPRKTELDRHRLIAREELQAALQARKSVGEETSLRP